MSQTDNATPSRMRNHILGENVCYLFINTMLLFVTTSSSSGVQQWWQYAALRHLAIVAATANVHENTPGRHKTRLNKIHHMSTRRCRGIVRHNRRRNCYAELTFMPPELHPNQKIRMNTQYVTDLHV